MDAKFQVNSHTADSQSSSAVIGLAGGAGVDELTGGAGDDWMWGGDMAGAGDGVKDTFIFGAAWGGDVIWDFENGSDMLDVSGAGISAMGQHHNATRPRIKSGEARHCNDPDISQ